MDAPRLATWLAAVGLALAPSAAGSQTCRPQDRPYFEFQVEVPAEFAGDTAARPLPSELRMVKGPHAALVQFVVDSLGKPVSASYRVLQATDPALAAAGREALASWRYRPARLNGCAVAQLVQTPLRP